MNQSLSLRRFDIRILCPPSRRRGWLVAAGLPFSLLIAGLTSPTAPAQTAARRVEQSAITVEAAPQLFAVMSALAAAGYDPGPGGLSGDAALVRLRTDMEHQSGPAAQALREFFHDHELGDRSENFSRYVSFALVVGPPPQFSYVLSHDQLPPDVLTLEGFQDLLVKFYAEAGLERRWASLAPQSERAADQLRGPLSQLVLVTSSYLREVLKPSEGRSFTVYVEPLVGNRTNFRNFGDHYSVVVGSGTHAPMDDIRHALLHYLIDSLPIRHRTLVDRQKSLLQVAARAPRLPLVYQQDFIAFFTECMVRAVELRLRHPSPGGLEAALIEADRSGFVLVRPLVVQLKLFEKSEPGMEYYFLDLLQGMDVAAEQRRVLGIQFAAAEAPGEKAYTETTSRQPSELERRLLRGEQQIATQDAAGAAATFEEVLQKFPDLPRAVYGLAIASVLQGNAARARQLFEKIVAPAAGGSPAAGNEPVDPGILAWSHVYLGRIHDLEQDRESAVHEYHAALEVEKAPEAARAAAEKGLETAYKPVTRRPGAEPKK
jgi:hypothetical protein